LSASIVTVQDAFIVPEAEQAPEMLTPPAPVGGPAFRATMVTWVPCANGATHVCLGGKVHVSPGGWVVTSPAKLEESVNVAESCRGAGVGTGVGVGVGAGVGVGLGAGPPGGDTPLTAIDREQVTASDPEVIVTAAS
jgi:hypothetical protein